MVTRAVLVAVLSSVSSLAFALVPSAASALDDAKPPLRFGLGVGIMGTLPVGPDVGQDGATDDEFSQALWMHLDLLTLDLGDHWEVGLLGRLSFLGGIDGDGVDAALDPGSRETAVLDGDRNPTGETKTFGPPTGTLTQWGLRARYFPFGDGSFRPFVGLGAGLSVSRASYLTRRGAVALLQAEQSGDPAAIEQAAAAAAAGGGFGGFRDSEVHRHTHRGMALMLSLGVRWDVRATAFGEPVRVPVALQVEYTRNQWLKLIRNETLETQPELLAPEGMQLDYLGLALTIGYLR